MFTATIERDGIVEWSVTCKSLGCAVKHAMAALQMGLGDTFNVTDQAGNLLIWNASRVTTLAQITGMIGRQRRHG